MNLSKTKVGFGVAFLTACVAAPARADVHVNIDVFSTYDYPTLGLRVTDVPVLQPSVTLDLPQGASIQAWASTTIEDIDRPADNVGSELDLIATLPKFWGITVKLGKLWYYGGTSDDYLRVAVSGPAGFTISAEGYAGASDAASLAVTTPAYELGAVTLQASANFTKTRAIEFEVLAGTATYHVLKNIDLRGQLFRTFGYEPIPGQKLDETRLMGGVGYHF